MLKYVPSDFHLVRFATYGVLGGDRLPSAAGAPYPVYLPRATIPAYNAKAYWGSTAMLYQQHTAADTLRMFLEERCVQSPDTMATITVEEAAELAPELPCPYDETSCRDKVKGAQLLRNPDQPMRQPLRSYVIDASPIIKISQAEAQVDHRPQKLVQNLGPTGLR